MPHEIGVAIELTGDDAAEAMLFAERVSEAVPTTFVLDATRTPHITLWQGRVPTDTVTMQLLKTLDRVVPSATFPFELFMANGLVLRESGNIFWNVHNPTALYSAHRHVCDNFVPLTKGLLMPYHAKKLLDASTPQETKDIIRAFGFSSAGTHFEPHVTIGRVVDADAAAGAISEIISNQYVFKPQSIVLGKLGPYGDIVHVYKRVPIQR